MVDAPYKPNELELLSKAIRFWQQNTYRYIELPWVVEERYTEVTRPEGAREVTIRHGNLVASGEQSFLKLWREFVLPSAPGYIGWTPCFRDEPVVDALHHLYFLKAELFVPVDNPDDGFCILSRMLHKQIVLFQMPRAAGSARSHFLDVRCSSARIKAPAALVT